MGTGGPHLGPHLRWVFALPVPRTPLPPCCRPAVGPATGSWVRSVLYGRLRRGGLANGPGRGFLIGLSPATRLLISSPSPGPGRDPVHTGTKAGVWKEDLNPGLTSYAPGEASCKVHVCSDGSGGATPRVGVGTRAQDAAHLPPSWAVPPREERSICTRDSLTHSHTARSRQFGRAPCARRARHPWGGAALGGPSPSAEGFYSLFPR